MNTQVTHWNPFKELEALQHRIASHWGIGRSHGRSAEESLTVAQWTPRVDISEDDKEFVIKAELPAMKKEDVTVVVEDGTLSISGERKLEKDEKRQTYHRIEREYGTFVRAFALPPGASGEKVSAEFKDGVLQVHVPKDAKAAAVKAVEIRAG